MDLFLLQNQILKSSAVIITLEKSLGSSTKDEVLPSLGKLKPVYGLCGIELDHGFTG